jgi:hypothetical protein
MFNSVLRLDRGCGEGDKVTKDIRRGLLSQHICAILNHHTDESMMALPAALPIPVILRT